MAPRATLEIFGDRIKKNLRSCNASDSFEYPNPKSLVLSKPGKHLSILGSTTVSESGDAMDVVMEQHWQDALRPTVPQLPQFGEPPQRFSSTMMTINNPAI
ncbi:hypothetical protein BYT27DRAFT_6450829 [Phlegmacium glaucopus]|nr:hypothetical protein BYT27DRAFT_6450829 [Phlegmacium glaucopus]